MNCVFGTERPKWRKYSPPLYTTSFNFVYKKQLIVPLKKTRSLAIHYTWQAFLLFIVKSGLMFEEESSFMCHKVPERNFERIQ